MSGHRPRKKLGQHFLHDRNIIRRIIEAIAPQEHEHFVEIGPGHGAITRPLLESVGLLDVIELDRSLADELRTTIGAGSDPRLRVHHADALKFDFGSLVRVSAAGGERLRVAGNLPYNVSSPLLFKLLETAYLFADLHIMLQKEVVDRMTAAPGNRTYGRLTVSLAARCRVERLFNIRPGAFKPPPKVDSAFVRIVPDSDLRARIRDERSLDLIVASAFSMRRKVLSNSLGALLSTDQLREAGVDPTARPEQLEFGAFVHLANVYPSLHGDIRDR